MALNVGDINSHYPFVGGPSRHRQGTVGCRVQRSFSSVDSDASVGTAKVLGIQDSFSARDYLFGRCLHQSFGAMAEPKHRQRTGRIAPRQLGLLYSCPVTEIESPPYKFRTAVIFNWIYSGGTLSDPTIDERYIE